MLAKESAKDVPEAERRYGLEIEVLKEWCQGS